MFFCLFFRFFLICCFLNMYFHFIYFNIKWYENSCIICNNIIFRLLHWKHNAPRTFNHTGIHIFVFLSCFFLLSKQESIYASIKRLYVQTERPPERSMRDQVYQTTSVKMYMLCTMTSGTARINGLVTWNTSTAWSESMLCLCYI